MENLATQIAELSLNDQSDVFRQLGIVPQGWLYAYRIPLSACNVAISHKTRREPEPDFVYKSKPGDWCLINTGSTAQSFPQNRLSYFHRFDKDHRPNVHVAATKDNIVAKNTDLMYCVQADISWEHKLRIGCYIGGWDIGGYTDRNGGFFTTASDWSEFLLSDTGGSSIGPTECCIIPTRAFTAIKQYANETYVYPKTSLLVDEIRSIVIETTLSLLNDAEKGNTSMLEHTRGGSSITIDLELNDKTQTKTSFWVHDQYK